MVPAGSELETFVEAEPNRVRETAGLSDRSAERTLYF
jgi:hypothetical protein